MTNLGMCVDEGGKAGIENGRVYDCVEHDNFFRIINDDGNIVKLYRQRFLLLNKILSENEYAKIEQWFSL